MVVTALVLMLIGCWLLTTQPAEARAPEHDAEAAPDRRAREGRTGDRKH